MGDFNLNILNSNVTISSYQDKIQAHGYLIQNTLPTRPLSGTLIDHIISNFDNTTCITLENSISDHNTTLVLFDSSLSSRFSRGYKTITKLRTNFDAVANNLANIDLQELDAKTAFTKFHELITASISDNTESRVIKIKMNNPFASTWVNDALIKLSNRKHRLLSKRCAGVVSADIYQRIATVSNRVNELKSQLKDNSTTSKYGPGTDSRTKWRNLNELLGRKKKNSHINEIKLPNDNILTEPKDIAATFNYHFANIQTPFADQDTYHEDDLSPTTSFTQAPSIFLTPTDNIEVLELISKLKN